MAKRPAPKKPANKPASNKPAPKKATGAKTTKKESNRKQVPTTITEEYIGTSLAQRVFQKYSASQNTRLISILGLALSLSLAMNWYNASKPTQYSYIAVTPDGRVIPLIPLDQPLPSSFDVGFWATQKAQQLFTLDYQNYKSQLSSSETFFTSQGWRAFEKTLGQSNLIGAITQNRYVARVTLIDAPVIESQGVLPGRGMYGWTVSFHIKLHLSSGNGQNDQEPIYKVDMLMLRSPQTISPDGIQIQNIAVGVEG